jgi:dihydrofolate reductase
MDGGTTFHFVTGGFDAALDQAKAAAAGGDIRIAGGASTVRQAFAAGAIDEITLDIAPVLLGRGERLFDGVNDPGLEQVEVTHSPYATHIHYRVVRETKR